MEAVLDLALAVHMRALRRSGRKAFIPFLTAGYPDRDSFRALLAAVGDADCLEIGLPWSDPVADGPSICHASDVALAAGMRPDVLFDTLHALPDLPPIVLMTYLNPVLAYGPDAFFARAAAAGVRGVILTDLPPEDGADLFAAAAAHGIASVLLVAPTTGDARMRAIARRATGFLYAVAVTGTTGARGAIAAETAATVRRLRAVTDNPVVVGFGVSTPEQVRSVCGFADGVVVGSALVDFIRSRRATPHWVAEFAHCVKELAAAAHAGLPPQPALERPDSGG